MSISEMSLAERLAFWASHPLVGEVPIALAGARDSFTMIVNSDDTVVKSLYWDGFATGWKPASLALWSERASTAQYVLDIGAYGDLRASDSRLWPIACHRV